MDQAEDMTARLSGGSGTCPQPPGHSCQHAGRILWTLNVDIKLSKSYKNLLKKIQQKNVLFDLVFKILIMVYDSDFVRS